jgi:hypothetical protein
MRSPLRAPNTLKSALSAAAVIVVMGAGVVMASAVQAAVLVAAAVEIAVVAVAVLIVARAVMDLVAALELLGGRVALIVVVRVALVGAVMIAGVRRWISAPRCLWGSRFRWKVKMRLWTRSQVM